LWSSEDVRVVNSGVAKFGDDLRNIHQFLPTKPLSAIAELYYSFAPLFPKQGESVVQLFRMAEIHRPGSGQSTTAIARARGQKQQQQQQLDQSGGKKEGQQPDRRQRRSPLRDEGEPQRKRGRPPAATGANKRSHHSQGGSDAEVSTDSADRRQHRKKAPSGGGGLAGGTNTETSQAWREEQHRSRGGAEVEEEEEEEEEGGEESGEDDEVARVAASQRFLHEAKIAMSPAHCTRLVGFLVSFDKGEITMARLVSDVTGLLSSTYPQLEESFRPFLPT